MISYRISIVLYIVGSLVVFGSWINIVPTSIGWIGWIIALLGWGVSSIGFPGNKLVTSNADEIAKLKHLYEKGTINQAEFEEQKRRILDGHR